ncbi:MAG TPA: LolA-related protein [Steroidobacteraceae bacterium]|nr:LolA-related protein [Steroidobacteraceae bacterium]
MSGACASRASRASRVATIAMIAALAAANVPAALAASLPAASTAATGPAQPAVGMAAVMRLLAARRHRRATFTETQRLAVLDRPIESAGELIYDAPGRLEERLRAPRRESLIVDGDRMIVERGGRRRVLALSRSDGLATLIGSLRATFAGDEAALGREFFVAFQGDIDHWSMRLEPRSAALAGRVAAIRIDGARGTLRRIVIRGTNGDRSVMRLSESAP